MAISLKSLGAQPAKLKLDPPGQPDAELYFIVVGQESNQYVAAQQAQLLNNPSLFEKPNETDVKAIIAQTAKVNELAAELLAECVIGWEGFEEEFSKTFLITTLKDPSFTWLVEQLADFVKERANFFPSKSKKK